MTEPSVWTLSAAVDEVMRQRRMLTILQRRETRLCDLRDVWRRRADRPDEATGPQALRDCADQIDALLYERGHFGESSP